MGSPIEHAMGDDVARQRRKREARLLDQEIVGSSGLTLADVVADVLAASDGGLAPLDVRGYLATRGHHRQTVEAVVDYLHRQDGSEAPSLQQPPLL
jgi:hypothetical protein